MISIAQNKIADFYRKKYKKNETSLDENIEAVETNDASIEKTDVMNQVLQLTDDQQMLLHLVFKQGLNYEEAAAILNVPSGTIKSRMHKIRGILKKGLGESYR